jgi:exopolysaccharide biosynthesis WecB/TagA/CpsF family protein
MNSFNEYVAGNPGKSSKPSVSYDFVWIAGDLLLFSDFLCIVVATIFSTMLQRYWLPALDLLPNLDRYFAQAGLIAAVLAPFMLYDQRFGLVASRGRLSGLLRAHVLRFLMFTVVVLLLGSISQLLNHVHSGWLFIWLATNLLLTSLSRILMTYYIRRLQRKGVLTEVVAVVGAGPVADRLVQELHQTRAESIELLGIFDDKILGVPPSINKSIGTLAQLIELGKTRKIDWIVLTLPPTAVDRLQALVHRLKALSVPIGLCPQHVGLALPYGNTGYMTNGMPMNLLADRPSRHSELFSKAAEGILPRWMVTLAVLPVVAVEAFAAVLPRLTQRQPSRSIAKLVLQFDDYDLDDFAKTAADFGQTDYGYVVTPNADHVIRLHEDASFRSLYAAADYILLDSRFLSNILRFSQGIQLPVCTGSDLTEKLFKDVIATDDPLVLIGGSAQQASQLAARYGLHGLVHHNPPMGFIRDPVAVEKCLQFIEAHSPFRFCLLAVGAPQQEALAQQLKSRDIARGLTLCIGASINFLTGEERRAPLWLQRCGMEWSYRLTQAPTRMAKRYLVRGPRVFGLLRHAEIVLRKRAKPVARLNELMREPILVASGPARRSGTVHPATPCQIE